MLNIEDSENSESIPVECSEVVEIISGLEHTVSLKDNQLMSSFLCEYKSALHYILLQPLDSGFSDVTDDFLLLLSNKEIGLLDIALSEKVLRDSFFEKAGNYYYYNDISCPSELELVVNRKIAVKRCVLGYLDKDFGTNFDR